MGRKTQVFEYHRKHGNLVEYAGFDLPVWFGGILSECKAVRTHAGVFDVSHMGRVIVEGRDAESFLNNLTTNNVSTLKVGRGQYSLLCNEKGGIIDDLTIFRLAQNKFLVVYNAGNREKDWNWLQRNLASFETKLDDVSENVAMFAVQGPRAGDLLAKVSGVKLEEMARYGTAETRIHGVPCLLTRSGYTGEDGFEAYVWDTSTREPEKALTIWGTLLKDGQEVGLHPAGLGARDVLRLEGGMCLYGNDIDENTSPVEARLGWVVQVGKDGFVGKDPIVRMKQSGPSRVRVGFKMLEKGIPRQGYEIRAGGNIVGRVTSGTLSPTLSVGIGMGFVNSTILESGEEITISIRGHDALAKIVKLPFYQRRSEQEVIVFGETMDLVDFMEK